LAKVSHPVSKYNESLLANFVRPVTIRAAFVSDGNWTVHIENIARSALKQVNVLRKLKYKFN
jgi:hypothetical protein